MSFPGYCIPRGIKMQKMSVIPHFYLQIPPKRNMNTGRHFPAKSAKYSNFLIIKTTAAIPTKFCAVISTTKYSEWVTCKCNMVDGRRLEK